MNTRSALYEHDGVVEEIECGDELTALFERLGQRVAGESYTQYRHDDESGRAEADYEVYEVYAQGETAADHPDGDPYADTISVPAEYAYADAEPFDPEFARWMRGYPAPAIGDEEDEA